MCYCGLGAIMEESKGPSQVSPIRYRHGWCVHPATEQEVIYWEVAFEGAPPAWWAETWEDIFGKLEWSEGDTIEVGVLSRVYHQHLPGSVVAVNATRQEIAVYEPGLQPVIQVRERRHGREIGEWRKGTGGHHSGNGRRDPSA